MRKLIFIALIVIFSAIYYYLQTMHSGSFIHNTIHNFDNMIKKAPFLSESPPVKQNIDQVNSNLTSMDSSHSDKSDTNVSLQELTLNEFKQWIGAQSLSMNMTNNDSDEIQIRLRAQAQTLKPQQLEILRTLALDTKLPINDRIFSAFLISMNLSAQSLQSLFDVAKAEVPDFGPISPHSEAELRHTQELALRYMQIDELFQRAKTDTNALDKLKLLVQLAPSAQVRSYAEKKLRELK